MWQLSRASIFWDCTLNLYWMDRSAVFVIWRGLGGPIARWTWRPNCENSCCLFRLCNASIDHCNYRRRSMKWGPFSFFFCFYRGYKDMYTMQSQTWDWIFKMLPSFLVRSNLIFECTFYGSRHSSARFTRRKKWYQALRLGSGNGP